MGLHERATARVCSKCKIGEPVGKTNSWCKLCKAAHERQRYASDPNRRARIAAQNERYYSEKRKEILAQKSEYGKRVAERDQAHRRQRYGTDAGFREKTKARTGRYYSNNQHVFRARDAKRRAAQLMATPAWADHAKIRDVYAEAARKTRETGIKHEVDHVFPLKGRMVSGLHVHFNLRVIPMLDNRRKFNSVEDIV